MRGGFLLILKISLEQKYPGVYQEFQSGKYVVFKSSRTFSAIAIDQAHEQANAVIKGEGGAIDVTEDPSALRRWVVAGPEVLLQNTKLYLKLKTQMKRSDTMNTLIVRNYNSFESRKAV